MDVETKRQELLALDKQKKALTDEAEAIISELTAEAPNGVSKYYVIFLLSVYTYCVCILYIYIIYIYIYIYIHIRFSSVLIASN